VPGPSGAYLSLLAGLPVSGFFMPADETLFVPLTC
jgi:hypothetical protein